MREDADKDDELTIARAHVAEGIPRWEHMIFTDQENATADPSPEFVPEDGPMVDFS